MAKAVPAPPRRPQLPMAPARSGAGRAGLREYLRGVWDELRKVQWPTRDELGRMTGIVIATVILFAVIIGGADYLLGLGVKQIYSTPSTTAAPAVSPGAATAAPQASAVPSAAPSSGSTPLP